MTIFLFKSRGSVNCYKQNRHSFDYSQLYWLLKRDNAMGKMTLFLSKIVFHNDVCTDK